MNIFSKIFRREEKISVAQIYQDNVIEILSEIDLPISDAMALKATVYLLFAQLACIHVVTKGTYQRHIDSMVKEVANSVTPLKMKVVELATSTDELRRILSDFSNDMNVDENTKINGLAGFNAIYLPFVSEVVVDIANHTEGPLGVHGYAAIKFLEGIRGKENGTENMVTVAIYLTNMTNNLLKAFNSK